jgi:hypothetical protein
MRQANHLVVAYLHGLIGLTFYTKLLASWLVGCPVDDITVILSGHSAGRSQGGEGGQHG